MSRHPESDVPLPDIDDRIVMPGTRFEVVDGEVLHVPPALPPHATRHSRLQYLLEAHVADDYLVACDMLTRTSLLGDMAPDASVYPARPDPETGGRQLEHLAFEIVSTQTIRDAGRKAARLQERGVRRVFAIDLDHERVVEWSGEVDEWELIPQDGHLQDPVLAAPLPLAELVSAARNDDAVARALITKGNRVIASSVREGERRGHATGMAEAIVHVLVARGVALSDDAREQILGTTNPEVLERWVVAALTVDQVAQLLALD